MVKALFMRFVCSAAVLLIICITPTAFADDCEEFLRYTEEQRALAALDVLTNATPTEKITLVILLGKACEGELPEFSRAEANKDAALFLPYLEKMESQESP